MPKQVIAKTQIDNKYQYLTLRWTKDDEESVEFTVDETAEFECCESNDGPRHLDWHDDCPNAATTHYIEKDNEYEFKLCDNHMRRFWGGEEPEGFIIIPDIWYWGDTTIVSKINITRKQANFLIKQMRIARDQVFGKDE